MKRTGHGVSSSGVKQRLTVASALLLCVILALEILAGGALPDLVPGSWLIAFCDVRATR